MTKFTKSEISLMIKSKLSRYFNATPKDATKDQIYKSVVMSVRDILLESRKNFNVKLNEKKGKRIYYLCIEFLLGRSLKHNVYNMELNCVLESALAEYGFSLEDLYEMEPDAGLGNGGLGRLAACFMDSLATLDYAAMGFSIRYEYGLFKQKIVDGWQMELPDVWLPGGEVWLMPRTDRVFKVKFDGKIEESWDSGKLKTEYVNATEVQAVGYDMMISGAGGESVSVLRLWRPTTEHKFDMMSFSQGDYTQALREDSEAELLGKVLYPSDNHFAGKSLRLKQQYFLVSASMQNIIADHKKRFKSLDTLPQYAAIHINDTHPALCIPELMRILMDENGYDWDSAWNIVTKTVAYTNHTVMSEALEKWEDDLLQRRLPRIYNIIKEINQRFCSAAWEKFPGEWDTIEKMAICSKGQIRMANLCVAGSHSVNGVSKLHSKIIKESIFKEFYNFTPEKFTNVTNGIAHRRWLTHSNKKLAALLSECIGDGFNKDAEKLKQFEKFKDDVTVLNKLKDIKLENKKSFADLVYKKSNIIIDPYTIFDVQAKRLHEYKRQLLNAIRIISVYLELKDNPDLDIVPHTYIFSAKAAPGYYMAKQIIKLICFISAEIEKNPKIREKLNVVFIENYCVTLAESLMPATEISQQISLAGKEASGTGNMKFMINGGITLGTLDGANIEIAEAVGSENIFIFGLKSEEVDELWKKGYNSSYYYMQNEKLKRAVDFLNTGFDGSFADLAKYLLVDGVADPYLCLADYNSYDEAHNMAETAYKDALKWNKMSLFNIANAGRFAADRSIADYAKNIWNLKSIK